LDRVNGQQEKMYLEDVPIHTPDQDRLGRSIFAKGLAESILSWRGEESIVIGIHGVWGSGKTSILNLIEYFLKESAKGMIEEERPVILRFNPWNFADQAQLMSMFFHQLAASLRMREGNQGLTDLAKWIAGYSDFFEPAGTLLFGPAGGLIGTLMGKGVELVGAGAKRRDEDFVAFRKEIDKALRKLPARLVIIIDDLDRLNVTEIKEMFQLVKLNADFPKTTYVMAFDRNRVARVLDDESKAGRAYLEKIVQVGVDVPEPEQGLLYTTLFEELDKAMAGQQLRHFDQHRWGNLFYGGLKDFFMDIRSVKRFCNALRLNYSLIAGEVNTVDFLTLEALRVFEPDLYAMIARSKDLLTPIRGGQLPDNTLKGGLEQILSVATASRQNAIKRILVGLFPQIRSAYENMTWSGEYMRTWRRELRICSPEMFNRYFILGVPTGEISELEIESILALDGGANELLTALRKLNEQGRLRRFLERMEDFTADVLIDRIKPLCQALLDIGDELPTVRRGFFDLHAHSQLLRIVYQLLKRLRGPAEVFDLLKQVISQCVSIFTPIYTVSILKQWSEETEPEGLVLESQDLQTLRELCLQRIQKAKHLSSLQTVPHLGTVLFYWKEWGNAGEVNQYVNDLIASPEGIGDFLAGFLSQTISGIGDYISRSEWTMNLENVGQFVDVEALRRRISGIGEGELAGLSERQRLAIATFRKAIEEKDQT